MTVTNPFTDHPASMGETYREHLTTATGFGLSMITGGLACLVHGLLPFLFVKTGSTAVLVLHERMVTHRMKAKTRRAVETRPI